MNLGYRSPRRTRLNDEQAFALLQSAIDEIGMIVDNFNRILSPESTERAFGALGVAGDADRIQHLGTRLMDVWRELLTWSADIRGTMVPDVYRKVFEIPGSFADTPI